MLRKGNATTGTGFVFWYRSHEITRYQSKIMQLMHD